MIEGTDLVHVRCHGEMTVADIEQITHLAEAHIKKLQGSYMLVDLRSADGMPGDARRLVVSWLREHRLAASVNYGANAVSRAFSSLAIRALRMLYGQVVENVFLDTESAARAWIDHHRAHTNPNYQD